VLLRVLLDKVAAVLSVSRDNISASSPLAAYGLDSIVAVEIQQWFKEAAGVEIVLFDVMGALGSKAAETQMAARFSVLHPYFTLFASVSNENSRWVSFFDVAKPGENVLK
jgi:aryl carrier-like protein